MRLDAADEQVNDRGVPSATWHKDVRGVLEWLDKLLVHGLDRLEILVDHALHAAAAFAYVAHQSAKDTHVGVHIHKHLQVHLLAQLW